MSQSVVNIPVSLSQEDLERAQLLTIKLRQKGYAYADEYRNVFDSSHKKDQAKALRNFITIAQSLLAEAAIEQWREERKRQLEIWDEMRKEIPEVLNGVIGYR